MKNVGRADASSVWLCPTSQMPADFAQDRRAQSRTEPPPIATIVDAARERRYSAPNAIESAVGSP